MDDGAFRTQLLLAETQRGVRVLCEYAFTRGCVDVEVVALVSRLKQLAQNTHTHTHLQSRTQFESYLNCSEVFKLVPLPQQTQPTNIGDKIIERL